MFACPGGKWYEEAAYVSFQAKPAEALVRHSLFACQDKSTEVLARHNLFVC